jgi:membrane-bound lytic murein transglycosylase B
MRQMLRFILAVVLALACASTRADDFEAFKTALWPDAQAKGIARATFDLALRGVTPIRA